MARRVGLPSPSTSPFGQSTSDFSQYDVLPDNSADDGYEFQKAQALWAAGKMSDDAYLAAYQKYVNGLDPKSSTYVNAKQSLDRERYTMARNDIVARIDAGDESAWGALLAYDQQSLSGLNQNSEEYQQRLQYVRSTQQAMFNIQYSDMAAKVSAGTMTNAQMYSWLRGQQHGGLTANNGALAQQIEQYAESMAQTIANERREKIYSDYQDGKMSPGEFINYARTQRNQFAAGTVQRAQWDGRMRAARLAAQDARMGYRWGLSQQYHENQQQLATPPPGEGKTGGTRKVYGAGGWREETLDYTPTASEVKSYETWQKEQTLLKAEQKRIERQLARAGVDFTDPGQMIKFYRERQKGVVKGTSEWLALQDAINGFRDTKAAWDTFKPENGFVPSKSQKETFSGSGRRLPTEGQINTKKFMTALGTVFGGAKQQALMGVSNRYGISTDEWRAWAAEYLGDASAKQTPDNLDLVVESRLNDLHKRYGSWAQVGYAWVNGTEAGSMAQWDEGSKQIVGSMWQSMGLGPLPTQWTFNLPAQIPSGSRGVDPTILGPEAPGQEYLGANVPSEPQLYAITGPAGPSGIPRTTKTMGLKGMTPGEFDSMYAAARRAFLDGETSFTMNGVNYYFPSDLSTRADTMGDLDQARVDLKYSDYIEAQAVVDTMGNQATQEQIDRADDARQKHAQAYNVMGQNAIDMLFMQQKAGYDPVTGADTGGKTNYNPGADYQRIEAATEIGIQQHLDKAAEWFSMNHKTQALVELQTAEDMVANARAHMQALDAQVQSATQQVQARGTNVTEEQRTDIEDVAAWEAKWGEEGEVATQILTQRNEVLPWVAHDERGNLKWSDDGTNVLDAPGTVGVLHHSQDGSPDTIVPTRLKTRPRPGQSFGSLAPEPFLENTLYGAVTVGGDTQEVLLPYAEEVVGNVRTADGQIVPVKGKMIWTNVNNLNQTIIENPFKPGTFQVQDGDSGQPLGLVWDGPEGFKAEQDVYGNQTFSWEANGNTYSMAWNANNAAYDLYEQSLQREGGIGPFGGERPEPTLMGNLGDNPKLADEWVGPLFKRDMSNVPKSAMAAQDMPGALVGMSAEQYGATQRFEIEQVKRQQATYARQTDVQQRGVDPTMPQPGQPISDEMRGVSTAVSKPVQREPLDITKPAMAQPMSQPKAPKPVIDGTPIEMVNPMMDPMKWDRDMAGAFAGSSPITTEPALPTPQGPRPTGTTPNKPSAGRKPIML